MTLSDMPVEQRWAAWRRVADPIYEQLRKDILVAFGINNEGVGLDIIAEALKHRVAPSEEWRKPMVLGVVGLTEDETVLLAALEAALRVTDGVGVDMDVVKALRHKRDVAVPRCPECGSTEFDYAENCVDQRGATVDSEDELIRIGSSDFGDGDGDPGLHCATCMQMLDPPEDWSEDFA